MTDYHHLCLTAQIWIFFTYVFIVVLIGYFGRRHHKPYGFRRNPMSICCLCNVYLLSCYSVCTDCEIKYVSTKSKILILRTGHMPQLLVWIIPTWHALSFHVRPLHQLLTSYETINTWFRIWPLCVQTVIVDFIIGQVRVICIWMGILAVSVNSTVTDGICIAGAFVVNH